MARPAIAFLIGCAYLAGALRIAETSTGYAAVGPRAFPVLIAIGFLFCAVWLAAEAIDRSSPEEGAVPADWPRWAGSAGLLAGYVLLFEPAGYLITTAAYFWLQSRLLGSRSGLRDGVVALSATLVIYFVFKGLLSVPLPAGLLG